MSEHADNDTGKLTRDGSFIIAVGGLVGGGIFSVLGVVIALAGAWAWLSLLLAEVVALLAASSYVRASRRRRSCTTPSTARRRAPRPTGERSQAP